MTVPGTIIEYGEKRQEAFSAAGCFCLHGDEILMIQRQKGKPFPLSWAIPTGKLDNHESSAQAASRELFEEVGIQASPEALIPLSDFLVCDTGVIFRYTSYIYHMPNRPPLNLKSDEIRSAAWVNFDKITKRVVVPFFWDTLSDLICKIEGRPMQLRLLPTLPATKASIRTSKLF